MTYTERRRWEEPLWAFRVYEWARACGGNAVMVQQAAYCGQPSRDAEQHWTCTHAMPKSGAGPTRGK